jgi:hypothetical protein
VWLANVIKGVRGMVARGGLAAREGRAWLANAIKGIRGMLAGNKASNKDQRYGLVCAYVRAHERACALVYVRVRAAGGGGGGTWLAA